MTVYYIDMRTLSADGVWYYNLIDEVRWMVIDRTLVLAPVRKRMSHWSRVIINLAAEYDGTVSARVAFRNA